QTHTHLSHTHTHTHTHTLKTHTHLSQTHTHLVVCKFFAKLPLYGTPLFYTGFRVIKTFLHAVIVLLLSLMFCVCVCVCVCVSVLCAVARAVKRFDFWRQGAK